jgi:hypothetical protein
MQTPEVISCKKNYEEGTTIRRDTVKYGKLEHHTFKRDSGMMPSDVMSPFGIRTAESTQPRCNASFTGVLN